MAAIIKVIGDCPEMCGNYGPFPSEEAAADYLRATGWGEQKTNESGQLVWIVTNNRYHGVCATIEPVRFVENLPIHYLYRNRQKTLEGIPKC